MQIFFMKNIIPITIIAFVLGAIGIGNLVQQKSIIETAYAEDEALSSGGRKRQESTEKPSVPPSTEEPSAPPSIGDFSAPSPMENNELPDEMDSSNSDEPIELPAGYEEESDFQMGTFPSGMQIIRTSFAANTTEPTEGPGPVEPPDPTDPHREKTWTGKHGGAKGQMDELPPVITMGEQPEDGGLTNVTQGYQPE